MLSHLNDQLLKVTCMNDTNARNNMLDDFIHIQANVQKYISRILKKMVNENKELIEVNHDICR